MIAEDGTKAKKADKKEAANFFFSKRTPCGRKEAGIMPSTMMGVASPWFTGAGSDLLVVKWELRISFKLHKLQGSGSRTDEQVLP
jgi:hypothetical protein